MVLVQLTICSNVVDISDHVPRLLSGDVLLHEEILRRPFRMLLTTRQWLERYQRKWQASPGH